MMKALNGPVFVAEDGSRWRWNAWRAEMQRETDYTPVATEDGSQPPPASDGEVQRSETTEPSNPQPEGAG